MRHLPLTLAAAVLFAAGLFAAPAQAPAFLAVDDVTPGMKGIGRTVFAGDTLEEFRVEIIGVLKNVLGPGRSLILARLAGGPLANTGVIAGMSGSPVYIDGRLVGAVSYSLGSFPKEPIAGITPIAEMTAAIDSGLSRTSDRSLAINWPAPASEIMAAIGRIATRAASPLSAISDFTVVGSPSLANLAPRLRPIGAAMVTSGLDQDLERELGVTPSPARAARQATPATGAADATLRPGDPVGVSLIHGDLEMGATGTVTHVTGQRIYAFGHPFLNLGSTSFPMTRARVLTVLPSLESSIKIASLGPIIGTISQDRATAVGGTLGAGPRELEVHVSLTSENAPAQRFTFHVLRDPALTPLFAYVAMVNVLASYERQTGALAVGARGTVFFGADGQVAVDDVFSGSGASGGAASALAAPIGAAMTNDFKDVTPERLDVEFRATERERTASIERAWLDTTRPRFGGTHNLQIELQDYRGGKRVLSVPVTMPSYAEGPLTLLVSDATNLSTLEDKELDPGKPSNWPELLAELGKAKRNNRVYVRLIASSRGTVVGGDTLPALPSSVRSVLDADSTVARATVTRTVVGSWEQTVDAAVRGSRELTLVLTPR